MLSFGGLLSEIVSGGSPGLNESNPGLVKFLGGAVFPVGLIMYVCLPSRPCAIVSSFASPPLLLRTYGRDMWRPSMLTFWASGSSSRVKSC